MADTKTYEVTEKAGPRVAGRRVKPGDAIRLTALEARSELLMGNVKPKGAAPKPPEGKGSGKGTGSGADSKKT